ncbi:hypothetical protein IB272_34610, partial [Ensifer sp. ENS08]|nr:hypothetical protein [Ensifer sp. ENS08]
MIGIVAGFKSERWPDFDRNAGRLQVGIRKVHADCAIEVDTNAYSVPWRLIGEIVEVTISGGQVRVFHAGQLVASHAES